MTSCSWPAQTEARPGSQCMLALRAATPEAHLRDALSAAAGTRGVVVVSSSFLVDF